jgi:AraC-like DNA-binding protein
MRATQFVEGYFDAWNDSDAKGVADHLATDGIYCDIPENSQRSHDELITNLTDFFATHHHRYELLGEILSSDSTIAFQYATRPVDSQPSGESAIAYRGSEFMTLNGDAAMTITDYYEMPGLPASELAGMSSRESPGHKYAKSGLNTDQLQEYKERLARIMHSQQAYLRSDLTLPKLAEEVRCSVNHLSQVINAGFGMSFFDYLNKYRIEHAREMLAELDERNGVILNIAFTVGFNSNSAFYAAFKKYVGETPAQYRRSAAHEAH